MTTNQEYRSEKTLAEDLGLPRATLGELRAKELREGLHWVRDGNVYFWTPAGVAVLESRLRSAASGSTEKKEGGGEKIPELGPPGGDSPPPSTDLQTPTDPAGDELAQAIQAAGTRPAAEAAVLIVVRLVVNKTIVLARREDEHGMAAGPVLTVRGVKNSALVAIKQRILATPPPSGLGPCWRWHGRDPRHKGEVLVAKHAARPSAGLNRGPNGQKPEGSAPARTVSTPQKPSLS